jgi:hypothetical protein
MSRQPRRLVAAALLALSGVGAIQALQSEPPWRDPSPHLTRWVTVDASVRLEVLDWGGTGPPLVLLGCYLTAHAYDDFAPKLTEPVPCLRHHPPRHRRVGPAGHGI